VSLQQGGRIGAQEGHPILLREAAAAQAGGETVDALRKLAVRILPITMHYGRFVGKDEGATAQETHRREFGSRDVLFHVRLPAQTNN
jgi:hypothetical protein